MSAAGISDFSSAVAKGKKGILLLPEEKTTVVVDGCTIETKPCQPVFFGGTKIKEFPLTMLYNKEKGYIDFTGQWIISSERENEVLAYTYDKKGFNGSYGAKHKLSFVATYQSDHAVFTAVSLSWKDKLTCNPNLDYFMRTVLS